MKFAENWGAPNADRWPFGLVFIRRFGFVVMWFRRGTAGLAWLLIASFFLTLADSYVGTFGIAGTWKILFREDGPGNAWHAFHTAKGGFAVAMFLVSRLLGRVEDSLRDEVKVRVEDGRS